MTKYGLRLLAVRTLGPVVSPAEVSFRAGPNVIAGASNTGKTYVFRCIDFMLGASTPPEGIPQSQGYTHCELEILSHAGRTFKLSRALAGGAASVVELSTDQINMTAPRELNAKALRDNADTISAFLLDLCGLTNREVRRNDLGQKSALSFRDVAGLTLVDEERIIMKSSPALSGQYTESTKEKSVFGLFLTGTDDAAIVSQEKTKERKARLQTELNLLGNLIQEGEKKFAEIGIQSQELDEQKAKIDASVREATLIIATEQAELDQLASKRDHVWKAIQEKENHLNFLGDQLKRLKLLRKHYDSDSARLKSSLEAGAAFERLPSGECSVCGYKPEGKNAVNERLAEFKGSCSAEIKKIESLCQDLEKSVEELDSEHQSVNNGIRTMQQQLGEINKEIESLMRPKVYAEDSGLSRLLATQSQFIEAGTLLAEVKKLRVRYSTVEQALSLKVTKPKLAPRVETRTAARFCDMVATTLKSWKYPHLGAVSFDPIRFDLVIGEQNRGGMGKGYRALTHAAFVISLMRYCRSENLPHTGLIVVDTPLNPFRGPDETSIEAVNQEVQNAFYSDLVKDRSGDQVVVLENTEPPNGLRKGMNYVHFSAAPNHGRFGYFPFSK